MATSMQGHKTLSLNDKVSQEGIYTLHHAWSDTSFAYLIPHPQRSMELGSKQRPGAAPGLRENELSGLLDQWVLLGLRPRGQGGRCPFCNLLTIFLLGPLVQENNLLSHHWILGQVLSHAQEKKKKKSQPHVEPSHSPFNTQISSFLLVWNRSLTPIQIMSVSSWETYAISLGPTELGVINSSWHSRVLDHRRT